jgi:hypothetical protein
LFCDAPTADHNCIDAIDSALCTRGWQQRRGMADKQIEIYKNGYYYLPPGYNATDPNKKSHVLILSHGDFLHTWKIAGELLQRYIPYADKRNMVIISVIDWQTDSLSAFRKTLNLHPKGFYSGFSSGGKHSILYAGQHPDEFYGTITHCSSSLDEYVIPNLMESSNWQDLHVFISCGTRDEERMLDALRGIPRFEQMLTHGVKYKFYKNVGHTINEQAIRDSFEFMDSIIAGKYKQPKPLYEVGVQALRMKVTPECGTQCVLDCDRRLVKLPMNLSKRENWQACVTYCKGDTNTLDQCKAPGHFFENR